MRIPMIAGAVLVTALAACGTAVPRVSPALVDVASTRWPGMDAQRLEAARSLYVAKCGTCHGLYPPSSCTEAHWPAVMAEMAPKSKLNADQSEEILRFVLAARAVESAR